MQCLGFGFMEGKYPTSGAVFLVNGFLFSKPKGKNTRQSKFCRNSQVSWNWEMGKCKDSCSFVSLKAPEGAE